jgi:hypothetical protein
VVRSLAVHNLLILCGRSRNQRLRMPCLSSFA